MDGEQEETFTLLPLQIIDSGKNKSCILENSSDDNSKNIWHQSLQNKQLQIKTQKELEALNELHQSLINHKLTVPPPPLPVNPKHSVNVTKLRESGNTSFRQGKHTEALRLYSLGLDMAMRRPLWEPCALFRDEVANLYANRSQVHMLLQNWPEGAIDAEASVEAKEVGNPKAWWRRGRCLVEMGRIDDAIDWIERALVIEGHDADLATLLRETKKRKRENKV
ncbi:Translocation protein sec72 [Erysiphe necator]|uniref:Putative tetratricopeptide repeat domain containing protein n=1 Tax=Uncinula necator TaxID=52586 RepID=A0A0B1P684_UNCNE|nr:Translocation protein sec72 [Erysiphe necator]KHJ34202.1 putative tetratricopeptide repeat domain containing protein [Erysiphe necator]